MNKQERTVARRRFDYALQLLFKYDRPTDEQVYHHLCTQNHCPSEQCTYLFGFKGGRDCDHVIATKRIIKTLLEFRADIEKD